MKWVSTISARACRAEGQLTGQLLMSNLAFAASSGVTSSRLCVGFSSHGSFHGELLTPNRACRILIPCSLKPPSLGRSSLAILAMRSARLMFACLKSSVSSKCAGASPMKVSLVFSKGGVLSSLCFQFASERKNQLFSETWKTPQRGR